MCSFHKVGNDVSYQFKTGCKIVVLSVLNFSVMETARDEIRKRKRALKPAFP
jgi:hypothetical protein